MISGKKATCTEFVGRKTGYFSRVDRESCVCYAAEARNVRESERARGLCLFLSSGKGRIVFSKTRVSVLYRVRVLPRSSSRLAIHRSRVRVFLSPFFHGRSPSLICRDEDGIDRSSGIFSITTHLYPLFDRFLRSRAWKSRVCTFSVREWMRFGRGPSKRLLTAKPTAPPLDL